MIAIKTKLSLLSVDLANILFDPDNKADSSVFVHARFLITHILFFSIANVSD